MRSRFERALPAACGFGAMMAGRGVYGIATELTQGTFKLSHLGVVLATFGVSTALALPIAASNIDKPNARPLEMSPWAGWLMAGILVTFGGTALWVVPEPHALRDGIIAALAFIAVFLVVYRVARAKGWTRS